MIEVAATLFVAIVVLRTLVVIGTWINSLPEPPRAEPLDMRELREQWWRERELGKRIV
jgi:hypothetical protein